MSTNGLEFFSLKGNELCVDKAEAYRYMGLGRDYYDCVFEKTYEKCLKAFCDCAIFKGVYKESNLSFGEGDMLHFDFCSFESKALKKNLEGCKSVIVFAATAGMGVDRMLVKYSRISQTEHMTADCIASAGIEAFCDILNEKIAHGKQAKPRFSLGYGDTSLIYQESLLDFLDAKRLLGISLNDSMMMTPKKSVTAFIGVK